MRYRSLRGVAVDMPLMSGPDRLVHNAYRVDLDGESIRKKRGRKPGEEQTQ